MPDRGALAESPIAASARLELRCLCCGYGVVVRMAPQRCPMCGGSMWKDSALPAAGANGHA